MTYLIVLSMYQSSIGGMWNNMVNITTLTSIWLSRAITLSSCPAIISSIFSPLWPPKRSILNPKYLLNNYLSLVFYLSVYRDKIFLNWTNFKIDCTCVLTFEFIMCLIFWYDLLCVHYEYIECNFNFFCAYLGRILQNLHLAYIWLLGQSLMLFINEFDFT